MRYCTNCVQPDTRPGIKFDEDGKCMACQLSGSGLKIDWDQREKELSDLVQFAKESNVSGYDCIVGVSGGKDSTRQALFVRDELKLNPLLVCCSYPPEQVTDMGTHNLANLISLGFDCISIQPAPVTWKKMLIKGFLEHGNWAKSSEMALYASAPKISIAYHIPLVFLGENPAIQVGGGDSGSLNADANKMKYSNTLKGGDPTPLMTNDISRNEVFWHFYPTDEEMNRINMKIRFLGYYWKDFTKLDNARFSIVRGLEIRSDTPDNIGDIFGFQALDDDFMIVNQMFKYLKLGFGQVTDEVCEEIRFGRMTREEAVELVNKYDGKCSDFYIKAFCDYTGLSVKKFWEVAEKFRNKEIWKKNSEGQWVLKTQLK